MTLFVPEKIFATCCKTWIFSRYAGELVTCFCGDSYISQDELNLKVSGNVLIELESFKKEIQEE